MKIKFLLFLFVILFLIIPYVRADLAPLPGQLLLGPYGLLVLILIVIDIFLFGSYNKNKKGKSIKKIVYLVLTLTLLFLIVFLLGFLLTYNPPRKHNINPAQYCIGLELTISSYNLNDSTITIKRVGSNTETKNVSAIVLVNGLKNTTSKVSDNLYESTIVSISGLKLGDTIIVAPVLSNGISCREGLPYTVHYTDKWNP